MGIFGKIGHFLGHNLSEASHVASFVPGIGPVVGGAMRAAGGLIEGDGLHDSLKNAAVEGIKNYGLGKLASAIPGVSSATDAIRGKLGSIPGVQGAGDFLKAHGAGNALQQQGGGSGLLRQAGDFLTGNGGKNALGIAEGVNAGMLQSKSNDFANNANASVNDSYTARAPLRQAGIAGMLNPGQGIQAKIAAIPQGANPYSPAPAGPPQIGRAV